MNKRRFLSLLFIAAIVVSVIVINSQSEYSAAEFEEENEERPDNPLTGEEKELFEAYLEKRANQVELRSAQLTEGSSYANDKIKGTWAPKVTHSGWYGYRVDNSAYDSLRNVFYVVSYAGHLYKMEYENGVKWELLNHKIAMNPGNNGDANPVLIGTLLPDSTFRLIRSNDDKGRMEFSDDEGRNWTAASGTSLTRSWSNEAFEATNNGQKIIVLHTYNNSYHHLYVSEDNGKTYNESSLSLPISSVDMRIVKPYNTNEAYVCVWNKISKTAKIYKYNADEKKFERKISSTSIIAGSNISNFMATYLDGKYHFYLVNSGNAIYYSSDEGVTWTQKNAGIDKKIYIMSVDKPNVLLGGFEDILLSTNSGEGFSGFGYNLGWDLQHMKTYQKAGGEHITIAGLDFGCYVSETPEDKSSYTRCNDGLYFGMHYDGATNENYNSVYLANQDRGTTAYDDSGDEVWTKDIDGTDVFRACYSNKGESVWTWFYYGRIRYRTNYGTSESKTAIYDGLGNWWAAPIIETPDPTENAIFAAYSSNLQKFKYDEATNSISKSAHPFNFKSKFGDEIGGFGYSELNRDIWYVALNNGTFITSKDGGTTWTKASQGSVKPRANDQYYNYAKNQITIKASKIDTNRVYYAGVGGYLFVSDNAGKSFSIRSRGAGMYRIRDFALSPDEKYVFAACGFGGAWIYSFDDNYWYQMSDNPIPSVDFTAVQFIETKNIVRFTTFGSGVMDLKLTTKFKPVEAPQELATKVIASKQIELSWIDASDNEDGFYVERAIEGEFIRIDTVEANISTYVDTTVDYDQTCYYRVKSFIADTVSVMSNVVITTVPGKGVLSSDIWTIIDFSSEEVNGENSPATNAIDNNPNTYWHTEYENKQPDYPHYLVIDLSKESSVAGFRYLPRQDGSNLGNISNYELYVSNDTANWGDAVATGRFTTNADLKEILLDATVYGRYVKFVALTEMYGKTYASLAELSILYKVPEPNAPINLTARIVNGNVALIKWVDDSDDDIGFAIEQFIGDQFVVIDSVGSRVYNYIQRGLVEGETYQYRIRAYNKGGYSEPTAIASVTMEDASGINELTAEWNVYPNPFTTRLNINLQPLDNKSTINLLNLNGNIVLSESLAAGTSSTQLEVADLPVGVYIIELYSDGKRSSRKILKK